ncbi:sulfite dehydrogenase (cytochrome) subunit SorB [Tistlia consotensis]|uniref:Sulfite dehydrogenase (Cytochrome) subunit SorB n=1 Tax=Tistlia consotensis USBA 355 TaxID=560819 RepID=A0A1Y6B439_9PROT|nr:sulfite:cytochrome C oxidoreductase subunit B [Tistlia consotensis]SME90794.1 sulfite dehydrogenase (cytochrome) subunit SorB [Tistlia consotensis USBA 355]SNR26939.1 sulfite dehydrogenase (cytochrome) subunit SorB [Tistlia consotensis]
MKTRTLLLAALGLALAAGPARAETRSYSLPDETAAFRPGPGVEAAEANCSLCHSADYIGTQPPHRGAAFWSAEVQKMIRTYHAPVEQADVQAIVDYLSRTY